MKCDCCNKEVKDERRLTHIENYPFTGFFVCPSCEVDYSDEELLEVCIDNQEEEK